jgi:hypothetical protein
MKAHKPQPQLAYSSLMPGAVGASQEYLVTAGYVYVQPGETFLWVNDTTIDRTVIPIMSSNWCLTAPRYLVPAGGKTPAKVAPTADTGKEDFFTLIGPQPCGVGRIIIR